MITKKFQNILIIDIILIGILGVIRYNYLNDIGDYQYVGIISFILDTVVFSGIVFHWIISIYLRVMHRDIRNYLILLGLSAILWMFVKGIKWTAFEYFDLEARFTWYCFYIFMIIIPVLGLLTALSINKGKDYKINWKWNLLFVPAIILIIFVMTNDYHQAVFIFNVNFENWNEDYSYGRGYFIIAAFISAIVVATAVVLIRNWRKSNRNKGVYLPGLVIVIGTAYFLLYGTNRLFANYILDLTSFSCLIFVLFWESYIQIGVIPSNINHKRFFENSNLSTQVLSKEGEIQIKSLDARPIKSEELSKLKEERRLIKGGKVEKNLAPIKDGYMIWEKDIWQITSMNVELSEIREYLNKEVRLMEEEKNIEEKRSRIKKLDQIYSLMDKEILPSLEKIEKLIKKSQGKDSIEKEEDKHEHGYGHGHGHGNTELLEDNLLKRINIISCYVKRKSNLLLQIENNAGISNSDMISCYNESFKGLGLLGAYCHVNYNLPREVNNNIHLLCYDFFQMIVEETDFRINEIFINCFKDERAIRFSLNLSKVRDFSRETFKSFEEELRPFGGYIKVEEEDESQNILLFFEDVKGVN